MIYGLVLALGGILWMRRVSHLDQLGYRRALWPGALLCAIGLVVLSMAPVHATQAPAIPDASAMYRRWVEQAVAEEWGVEGSTARLAAQIHQESSWNAKAHSSVGAEGLAQFMPSTSRWIATQFPDKLGTFDPWDAQQAALAAAVYDAWLVQRNPGHSECDTWSFALSAYNGGEKQLRKEQTVARAKGLRPDVWPGQVATMRTRSMAAWTENRGYVRRILGVLEPAYLAAGWSGRRACP